MKKKINYPLNYGLSKTGLPLVVVEMYGKNLCMLIDTGATLNLLDKRVYNYFSDKTPNQLNTGLKTANFGIDGIETDAERVEIEFLFEGCIYTTKFTIFDVSIAFDKVREESGIQIHGILGNEFLLENEWIIDFEKTTIYSQNPRNVAY
jgi:hypothetical protein